MFVKFPHLATGEFVDVETLWFIDWETCLA